MRGELAGAITRRQGRNYGEPAKPYLYIIASTGLRFYAKTGIKTPKAEIDMIEARIGRAEADYAARKRKGEKGGV